MIPSACTKRALKFGLWRPTIEQHPCPAARIAKTEQTTRLDDLRPVELWRGGDTRPRRMLRARDRLATGGASDVCR
jgi:hypothetical protein